MASITLRKWKNQLKYTNGFFLNLLRRSYVSATTRSIIQTATKDGELRVFIVAGEVSGDTIGSRLMASLKNLSDTPVRFSGVGGFMMSKEGLESLFPMEDISVMGIWELLPHLNKFRVKLKETIEAALLFQPHVVVTVDSKGFSFRLLKQLRARYTQQRLDCPVHFHYVAPSFWAWKGGEERLKFLANFVDHVFCILPNEESICKSNGLAATFVGHPILEEISEIKLGKQTSAHEWKITGNSEEFRRKHAVPSGATVISLLPGSRLQEVTRMLSIFSHTMEQLKDTIPDLTTIVHVAPNQQVENYIRASVHKWPVPALLLPGGLPQMKYDAFSASDVALCTSGTVALELQLARLPCVVAYRAHLLTEWIIRYKAKIRYMSLPNILMDLAIIPEALFRECTPTKLASLLMELIHDSGVREKQIVAAEKVMHLLYPSERCINSLAERNTEWSYPICTPSMIAATTILQHVKPRRLIRCHQTS
ncbi:probable lipid-A-disaccharide synthase, mitochondrial [Mercurialis annua]|uniref:probable lipid-A-disaccharide synthase, mitochondrial n=1 Tax=Mercurialis annua TaxID=3986 RepID=UPI00215FC97E|nr:probable lipid-A-disaccharide synthase, mitochondrial [Mercurialis annua]XP_050206515.1 probable lipid-A-disaccharide synthase, mitochondrial [Mercurialis annua]